MPDDSQDKQAYEHVLKRVEELRGFYSHLGVYLVTMLGLFLINMLANPHHLWFLYPLVGWGVFVLFHGATVLVGGRFGRRWEERKTRQLMAQERSRWGPQPPQPRTP